MKIKKVLASTKAELKSHQDANVCYISEKTVLKKLSKSLSYCKVREHCHYTGKYRSAAKYLCNLKYNVPNEVPVVFHNGSKYNYRFITKN